MSQNDRESISALLDNEADDLELRRFLKASEKDPSLLETWERFSLVQSALHEPAHAVSPTLSQRIAAQIEQEAPLTAASEPSSWKQGISKMAIAASVAAVFLFTVQISLDSGPAAPDAPLLVDQPAEQSAAPAIDSPPVTTLLAESPSPDAELLDTRYLREFIDRLTLDDEAPVVNEQIQDSPLYRLVNDYQVKP